MAQEMTQEIDMTKPQPCTKYSDAATTEWVAKLYEETHEVAQEAIKLFVCTAHSAARRMRLRLRR